MRITPLLLGFSMLFHLAEAQNVVLSSGVEVFIASGCEVYVSGDVQLESLSTLESNGDFTVDGNLTIGGIFNHPDGNLRLTGNWTNNDTYSASGQSRTFLDGNMQNIAGSSSSTFQNLDLQSNTACQLAIDASAFRFNLGNSTLRTAGYSFQINDPSPSALTVQNGKVSSAYQGQFRREMLADSTYLFPVGDESQSYPVFLTPSIHSNSGVRFAAVDANEDNLFRSQIEQGICQLSSNAYVQLYDLAPNSTMVSCSFLGTSTQGYPILAERALQQVDLWSVADNVNVSNAGGLKTYMLTPSKSNAALIPGRLRPEQPVISGPEGLCLNSTEIYSIESAESNSLLFTVDGGNYSAISENELAVTWNESPTGLIEVIQTDTLGCSSFPSVFGVDIYPLPIAEIEVFPPDLPFEDEVFSLTSLATGANQFIWETPNSEFLNQSSIQVAFANPGTYKVSLFAENEFGCKDTANVELEVIEGFVLSNVITPNGDGVNDEFILPNSGLTSFHLDILNRWGNLIFSSDAPKMIWDGRTASGELVTPGTYFYVLIAHTEKSDYSHRGTLQVIY